ncbi:MAG: urease accessory protein UreD, partial [Arthrobacter sp.]
MSTTADTGSRAVVSPWPAPADKGGRARSAVPATPRPPLSASADRPEMGRLDLVIAERAGRSVAAHQFHRGALRILRPHYLDDSGQVCYVLVNPGGAYLGADLYLIDVEVGDGAALL